MAGDADLAHVGVDVDGALAGPRPPIRYCVDWSEQAHHLSGALGAALAARMFEVGWVARLPRTRAVRATDEGRARLPTSSAWPPPERRNVRKRSRASDRPGAYPR